MRAVTEGDTSCEVVELVIFISQTA